MITLVIEAFYAVMFARSLVIAAMPLAVGYIAVALLLAQRYLTLRLVSALRPVSRRATRVALCVFVLATVPFYFLGQRQIPLVTLVVVSGFFAVPGVAAVLLVGAALRCSGEDDARLLGDLGAQAAIPARRGAVGEATRTLNAQLEEQPDADRAVAPEHHRKRGSMTEPVSAWPSANASWNPPAGVSASTRFRAWGRPSGSTFPAPYRQPTEAAHTEATHTEETHDAVARRA
jgi:hypothetical protein